MMTKYLKVFGGVLLLIMVSAIMIPIYESLHSLFFMENKIVFSSGIVMYAIGFPLIFYAMSCVVYVFIFERHPKYHMVIGRYLSYLIYVALIAGIPISFGVGFMLKSDGYQTCDKISWMSPTTYVKDLSFCD